MTIVSKLRSAIAAPFPSPRARRLGDLARHHLAEPVTLAAGLTLALASSAAAHNIDIEAQSTMCDSRGPWCGHFEEFFANAVKDDNPRNWSFANPYDLTQEVPVLQVIEDGEIEYDVDPENGTPTWLGGILTSRATFGYLDGRPARKLRRGARRYWNNRQPDVDVFDFTVTPGADLAQAQSVPAAATWADMGLTVAVASPIPPACEETVDDYPAIALTVPCALMIGPDGKALDTPIGPAMTMWMGEGELPFDSVVMDVEIALPPGVPPATVQINTAPSRFELQPIDIYDPSKGFQETEIEMCVAQVAFNIPSDERVTFFESHTANTWYLPTGCIVTEYNVPICNGDFNGDGIPEAPPAPGIFYPLPAMLPFPYTNQLVVWNPEGSRMDYTLNSGFAEGFPWVAHNHELEEEIENNGWMVHDCDQVVP